jgi:hypothetical protein
MAEDLNIISPKEFVSILKRRVHKDWDAVVGITGEEGSSKSTLASWLVYEGCLFEGLSEEEALKKFVEYTIFSPNQDRVQEQITQSERYSIINADEAIKILYKQNWASPIQKFLNMFYALCRQENKISVLCMPRFLDFNEFFRNHRIKFWVHVLDRGVAVIMEKDWFPSSDDPWFLKDAMKMNTTLYARKKTADFNVDEKIRVLSRLKNFVGVIHFEDLPNKVKKVYRDGKAEFAYEDIKEQIKVGETPNSQAESYKNKLVTAVKNLKEKGVKHEEIALILDISTKTVTRYLQTPRLEEGLLLINKTKGGDNFL